MKIQVTVEFDTNDCPTFTRSNHVVSVQSMANAVYDNLIDLVSYGYGSPDDKIGTFVKPKIIRVEII